MKNVPLCSKVSIILLITYIKKNVVIDGVDTAVYSGYTIYDYFGQPVIQLSQSLLSDKPFRLGDQNGSIYYYFLGGVVNDGKHLLTTHKYDVWGRETKTTLPDSTQINTAYAIDSSLFKTSVTDALNQTSNVWKDVRGLQVKIQSPLGITDNYLTRFLYDGIGLLKQTTDPEGHPTTFNYDVLGRTLSIDHPSRGLTFYTYDGATPNVKTETNAKHEVTSFDYDILGRPTHKHFSVNPQNDVYYQYGESTDGLNAGKLTKMQDATGVSEFEYGNMGEVTAQNRMHILPNKSWLTHRTEWYYDSWGRTKAILYPDGEKVSYFYNNAGNLNKVQSGTNGDYISNIKYNKNEQKHYVEYGNGTYALYEYDTVMQRLLSYDLQNSSKKLMRKDYHYNQIGNIDILNSNYQDVGISISENYKYDKDNRLIEANGNNGGAYKLNMEYSRAGRIESKYLMGTGQNNSGSFQIKFDNKYEYNRANNPYAVSGLVGKDGDLLQWDDNGNLCFRARQGEYFYWTENNSMQGYYNHKTNTAAFYRYDASGTRDLKMTAKVTDVNVNGHQTKMPVFTDATLYAGNLMTVNKNGYTKHYFAGTERILANVAGKGTPLINTREEISSISEENVGNLSVDFTTFAEDYFVDINDNACQKNGIELPAEMGNLPPLGKIFERAIQQNVQDRLYYFNSDHLSSASLITNSAGQTYQTLAYCVYGTPLIDLYSGDYDVENKYTGQIFDEENGMYLFGIRHFNPLDNITPTTDQHWYNYPHISSYNQQGWCPTMITDPTGMEWEIDGFIYQPGQASPVEAAQNTKDKWDTMNKIYQTKNGKKVIDDMKTAEGKLYSVSSDAYNDGKKTYNEGGMGMYVGNYDGTGGTIFLNGTNDNMYLLSHEMFHGYQDLQGQAGLSIYTEIEAYLFSYSVQSQFNVASPTSKVSIVMPLYGSAENIEYNQQVGIMTFEYSTSTMNYLIDKFKKNSGANFDGKYNDYPLRRDKQKNIIKDFYPLIP